MKIRVCDDVAEIADEWVAAIRAAAPEGYDVNRMVDAKTDISKLLDRKIAVERQQAPLPAATAFDDIDVLVVDYDLLHLDEEGGRTTGEGVARLARTFSTCGLVIVMNQFKGAQFDLGMRGHLESYADLNVDATLIGSPPLWQSNAAVPGELNPTFWTPAADLLVAARGLSQRIEKAGLEAAAMSLVGLDAVALGTLSDTAFGFLSVGAQTAEELATLSIRNFLLRWLEDEAVDFLLVSAPNILLNFAAFRLAKWLERAVLRPMDVLVDSAHLVERLPFLLDPAKAAPDDAAAWNAAAASPSEWLRWALVEPYVNRCASETLGKIVFDWYRMTGDAEIDRLQDDYLVGEHVRYFLAEDTSRFVGKEAVTRFRADFHNFGDRRAVERLADISYGPLRRIRFG